MSKVKQSILVEYSYANCGANGGDTTQKYTVEKDPTSSLLLKYINDANAEENSTLVNSIVNKFRLHLSSKYIYPEILGNYSVSKSHSANSMQQASYESHDYQIHFSRPRIEMLIVDNKQLLLTLIDAIRQSKPAIRESLTIALIESLDFSDFKATRVLSWNQEILKQIKIDVAEITKYGKQTCEKKQNKINSIVRAITPILESEAVENLHCKVLTHETQLDILSTKLTLLSALEDKENTLIEHQNKFYKLFNFVVTLFTDNYSAFFVKTTSQEKVRDLKLDIFSNSYKR